MNDKLITLGIETSCDETAASVMEGRFTQLSSVIASQDEIHNRYGGIVPELACRRHLEMIRPVVNEALERAGKTLDDVGLIAATRGPGLVGALLVGLSYAKALAWGKGLPMVGVNHLEGHLMSAFVHRPDTPLPAIALLVSGGHTELFLIEKIGQVKQLGGTRDDAAGEAFDKVARMLGLGYPGGQAVEQSAKSGTPVYDVPVAMAKTDNLDFSFSGPKTAVKYIVKQLEENGGAIPVADVCASFQDAVARALTLKTRLAVERYNPKSVALVGGVARNGAARNAMEKLGDDMDVDVVIPDPVLCSDNAVMIASAGACAYLDDPINDKWKDFYSMDAAPSWTPGAQNDIRKA